MLSAARRCASRRQRELPETVTLLIAGWTEEVGVKIACEALVMRLERGVTINSEPEVNLVFGHHGLLVCHADHTRHNSANPKKPWFLSSYVSLVAVPERPKPCRRS